MDLAHYPSLNLLFIVNLEFESAHTNTQARDARAWTFPPGSSDWLVLLVT